MVPRQKSNMHSPPDLLWLRSPGMNTSEQAFTCLSQECVPLPLTACVCAGEASWTVTYGEQQCGWERGGECWGCHNRKRGDITRPSGVTEADGAGMWLNYPCGIWLRRQGVLSSFPRQREEVSGASFTVSVLFYQIGPNGSSKHCGLGKEVFQHIPWLLLPGSKCS